jgi:BirA family biotin operon repressor/biotin-[acetyl-CoA-carboxylase] ligase
MVVYTDSIDFAEQALPSADQPWSPTDASVNDVQPLVDHLYEGKSYYTTFLETESNWRHLFLVEFSRRSQYDLLIDLTRGSARPPDAVLCLTGASDKLHGFKNRAWTASLGNIHLSVHLTPDQAVEHFGVGFTILAAVSVVDAIDSLPGLAGRAGIKWVNDILIEGAKVCGVLAYTQSMKDIVSSAVLGIGLNVEATPEVEPTPQVPRVAALREFTPDPSTCTQSTVLEKLIHALDRNYRAYLDGGYKALLDRYRELSLVIGREATVRSDDASSETEVVASGRVVGLGENLELLMEGIDKPVTRGRLILHREDDT